MPEFVLNRTHVLAGKGHMIRFVKGEPTYVPPELVREAVAIGADPVEGDRPDVLDPEEIPEDTLTAEDKEKLFFAAFDKLIARNEREDFDGSSKPAIPALKELLTFSFTKKDRDLMFQKYRELKAE